MCNACGFHCCAWDGFGGCGCDHCWCSDCWDNEEEDYFDDEHESSASERKLNPALGVVLAAALALGACASNGGQPPDQSLYLQALVRGAANTVNNVLLVYGPLPTDATDVVQASRDYAEGVCTVMTVVVDGVRVPRVLTPQERIFALQTELMDARERLKDAENDLLDAGDVEPGVKVGVLSLVDLARDLADTAVALETDPANFVAPCNALARVPRIITSEPVVAGL